MNYIHNLQNEFVESISNTLWTATDAIKKWGRANTSCGDVGENSERVRYDESNV